MTTWSAPTPQPPLMRHDHAQPRPYLSRAKATDLPTRARLTFLGRLEMPRLDRWFRPVISFTRCMRRTPFSRLAFQRSLKVRNAQSPRQ
jgi:hypothetical protein